MPRRGVEADRQARKNFARAVRSALGFELNERLPTTFASLPITGSGTVHAAALAAAY